MQVVYQGVEFEVEFYADKGHPGSYWEPPEPPEFYISSIQINNVEMMEWFTEDFITEFEKFLIELLRDRNEY